MNVLYLSYDGMTDPLGQSQVLPYLKGLSEKGVEISLISFEKEENFSLHKEVIDKITKENKIIWYPQKYTKKPPVVSTMKDIRNFMKTAEEIVLADTVDLIHCRSYISALVGLKLYKKYDIPFLFDMRGFWANERVDGGIWSLKNPVFKKIYRYFKKKEKEFLTQSAATVSLTQCGKDEIESWKLPNVSPIEIIPCCTDEKLFSPENIDLDWVSAFKRENDIAESDFVISYLGSIGTWYLLSEMLDFAKVLFEEKENAKMLFITKEPKQFIYSLAQEKKIDKDRIIVLPAKRNEVPNMLSVCAASLFFIKPAYSKKASSPTKMGEIMNLGIPVICNSGVGDTDIVMNEVTPQLLVQNFTNEEYLKVISSLNKIDTESDDFKNELRNTATKYFSLEKGIEKYYQIYQNIITEL